MPIELFLENLGMSINSCCIAH